MRAYDLLTLNDCAKATGIQFVPIVVIDEQLVELLPLGPDDHGAKKLHVFIKSLDGPPQFLFAPDYKPM